MRRSGEGQAADPFQSHAVAILVRRGHAGRVGETAPNVARLGQVRVVDPDGEELCRYAPRDYLAHVAEHVLGLPRSF